MNILFDTNVVIDLFTDTDDFKLLSPLSTLPCCETSSFGFPHVRHPLFATCSRHESS